MIFSCTSDLSISENQPFPSLMILLDDELVLFETQCIRHGRFPIPIFDHKLVAEVFPYNSQIRSDLV